MRGLIFVLLLLPSLVSAQLTVEPIPVSIKKDKGKNTRTQSQAPLPLPFWDDFSFTETVPSDSLWQNSENIRISADVGLNPPSINVASFDGLMMNGQAYSASSSSQGETDVLTSCPIALSTLNINDDVYLSFFYQFGGIGDVPEESQGDSLILEFLSVTADTTIWQQVWPHEDDEIDRTGSFIQEIIRLDNEFYFTDEFQFRFRSFGRQSGLWDTWNVDYVYLNDDRNENDLSFPDRTVTSKLTSPFEPYTSIPAKFFSLDNIGLPRFTRFNLDIDGPIAQSVDYILDVAVSTFLDGTETNFTNSISNTLDITSNPGVSDSVESEQVLLDNFFTPPFDSLFIDYTFKYGSNDGLEAKFDPIDFRINDTIQTKFELQNYYAYDDGTAEFGAGFQTSGNRLAYQFTLPEGVSDTLTGMDVYFPFIFSNPTGKQLTLTIWGDNGGEPGDRLFQQDVTAVLTDSINRFFQYEFSRPVLISGTFYIGYRQSFEGDLRIGLDRNTNSVDKIFTNTAGFWELETDFPTGSLMMRPVFGSFDGIINSIEEELKLAFQPFPNPSSGIFNLPEVDQVNISDLYGRPVNFTRIDSDQGATINISNAANGIYLLNIKKGKESFSLRIVKH